MSQVQLDNFYSDIHFTVYNGDENTLPTDGRLLIILFDDPKTPYVGERIGKQWYMHTMDKSRIRISVGDAWAKSDVLNQRQYCPKVGEEN